MKQLEDLAKKYEAILPNLKQTQEEVDFVIKQAVAKSDIKIHSIQSRIKQLPSLQNKAGLLEIEESDKVLSEVKDILGFRIICLFLSEIEPLSDLIEESFEVLYQDNKIDGSEISSFGYFSVHFICKLKSEYQGPRYDSIKDVEFEIQVRTISMDAWANISHYLDYKSEIEIPKDLKRDFYALSGLFYVADTHFEMFFKNKKAQAKIAKQEITNKSDTDINFETVEAYINSKFKNRKNAESDSISKLTQELIGYGFKTINELDRALKSYFTKIPEINMLSGLNRVGIVRATLKRHDKKYDQYHKSLMTLRIKPKK